MVRRARPPLADLVTGRDVATMLGWPLRRVTSYVAKGRLPEPVGRLAGRAVWTRAQIEEWAAAKGHALAAPVAAAPADPGETAETE